METSTDLNALKHKQQAAWASGDYAVIGTTLQIVGESLAEACDLCWDERVLDVAAGNGNASLGAARRGCKVTSTDYVGALLERGAERARADHLEMNFQTADAEALPFADASFDVVLSTFGVMFTPDWYGPVHKAFAALPADGAAALEKDLTELLNRMNRAGDGTLVVPSEYLEIVVTRSPS